MAQRLLPERFTPSLPLGGTIGGADQSPKGCRGAPGPFGCGGDFLSKKNVGVLPRDRQKASQSVVRSTIRLTFPPKKLKEALTILKPTIEQTKLEPGCIGCRLYQDLQEERALMLESLWSREEDLWFHVRSPKFLDVLLVMEMAAEAPEVRFDLIGRSWGLEAIEKARG